MQENRTSVACLVRAKKKKKFVSDVAGGGKKIHPGGRISIFFENFCRKIVVEDHVLSMSEVTTSLGRMPLRIIQKLSRLSLASFL